jgi:hypothetical protein
MAMSFFHVEVLKSRRPDLHPHFMKRAEMSGRILIAPTKLRDADVGGRLSINKSNANK